jgi:hypothetical protein
MAARTLDNRSVAPRSSDGASVTITDKPLGSLLSARRIQI